MRRRRPAVSGSARRRPRRRLSALLGILCLLLVSALGGWVYLRRDASAPIAEVAGTYAESRVLRTWDTPTSRVREVELVNHRGEGVAVALFRFPHEPSEDLDILLTFAGVNTGEVILEMIPERPSLGLVAMQYPYRRPEDLGEILLWPRDLRRAAFRTAAGGMLAVSALVAEGHSSRRLTVLGSSVGAPFAILLGALDSRVPRVVVVHPAVSFPGVLRAQQEARGRPWRGAAAAFLAWLFLDSFDPVHHVDEISPRELVIIAARRDRYFSAEATQALFDRAEEPKTLLWTDSGHVRSRRDELSGNLVRLVDELLPSRDEPPPKDPR